MNIDHTYTYTSALGAVLDDEIMGAMRAGMPLEAIYCELTARAREIGDMIARRHIEAMQRRESEQCAA